MYVSKRCSPNSVLPSAEQSSLAFFGSMFWFYYQQLLLLFQTTSILSYSSTSFSIHTKTSESLFPPTTVLCLVLLKVSVKVLNFAHYKHCTMLRVRPLINLLNLTCLASNGKQSYGKHNCLMSWWRAKKS